MGQKVNPLSFRLGNAQNHYSLWFAHPKNYPKNIEEDIKIRDFIQNYVEKNIKKNVKKKIKIDSSLSVITHIEIKKKFDLIDILIYVGFKNLIKESLIKELQINLQKELINVNKKINIVTILIAKPYRNPLILAQYVASQLKKRVPFRKTMKMAIEKIKKTNTKGIRIQISGRLDGNDIARVAYIKKGRIPLQTIRYKIDYCSYPVETRYGLLGIKIWIF
uniref:Small ribosomal subunit protein uS3c n=1 Tax=Monotropa uniflora TaxID=50148 RepID=A0A221SR10_MONUN|nr:ribosomal protein S3 [Monotropa uniflora]ASN78968.1 ribosomal protein S3 [Monotropa uniflora]